MADIILRRTFTSSKVPTTSELGIAQLANNVPDGKIYLRKSGSGVDRIVSLISTETTNSGSLILSGTMTITNGVTGSNLFATASNAISASYVVASITKEWHVSSGSGNDTTGDGSILRPFKTLAKASSSLGNTGERLVIHPGTYTENITFPQLNFTMTALGGGIGGDTYVNGTFTFTGASSSNKINGIRVENILLTGNSNLYLDNVTVSTTFNKSGNGYLEANNSSLQGSAILLTGTGTHLFQGCKLNLIFQNNAASVVSVLDSPALLFPTIQAGTALIANSNVYSISSGSAAVSASAASVVFLQNSAFYNANGGAERVILGGAHGFDNVLFNRDNSVFGTSLVAKAQFQHLQATAVTSSGLFVTGTLIAGNGVTASGLFTVAAGKGTIASGDDQVVVGNFNRPFTGSGGFVVGNGTSNVSRSILLAASGSQVSISGSLYVGYVSGSGISGSTPLSGSNIFGTASWAMNVVNGGGATVVVSASLPPTGSSTGSLWWNTNDGNLYVQAGNPTGSTWVPAVTSVAVGPLTSSFSLTASYVAGITVPDVVSMIVSGAQPTQNRPTGSLWYDTSTGIGYVQVEDNGGTGSAYNVITSLVPIAENAITSSYALTASYALNSAGGGGGTTKVSGWPGWNSPLPELAGVLVKYNNSSVPQIALTGSTDTMTGAGYISKGTGLSGVHTAGTAVSTTYQSIASAIGNTGGILDFTFRLIGSDRMFRLSIVDQLSSDNPLLCLELLN